MANIKSAKKRIKVIDKKTARNKRVKDHVKEALRAFDDAMGGSLKHVHISDRSPDGLCVLPFSGVFDIEGFVSGLAERGYDGDLIIEVYRTGFDNIQQLRSSGIRLAEAADRITGAGKPCLL